MKRSYISSLQIGNGSQYSGYVVEGKPSGYGEENFESTSYFMGKSEKWRGRVIGQWHEGKMHGVILRSGTASGFSGMPHFSLELYRNNNQVSRTSFSDRNNDGTPSDSSFYWDKLQKEIRELPNDNYEASERYYESMASYLYAEQSIIDANVERYKEAERERELEEERSNQAEERERYLTTQYNDLKEAKLRGELSEENFTDRVRELEEEENSSCRIM